jgi:hypothetical protein
VVFLLDKRNQVRIPITGNDEYALAPILRLVRVSHDIEQATGLDGDDDLLESNTSILLEQCVLLGTPSERLDPRMLHECMPFVSRWRVDARATRRMTVDNPESEISVLCGIGVLHRVPGSKRYSVRYRVVGHTEYRYVQPVALCHNETHLRHRAVAHQRCLSHALVIDPEPDLVSEREDFFGNPTASFSMQRSHSHLSVTATSEVEVGSPKRPGQVPCLDSAASPPRCRWPGPSPNALAAPTRTTQSPIGPSDTQYRLQNRVEPPILHSLARLDDTIMDPKLTAEELSWLKNLDTDSPIKPEVPESIAARLVEQGLAIKLVEGGLQLTALGREQLRDSGGTKEL